MTISAVIPTYNRYESLIRTLVSLSKQKELPDEVLVVDASTVIADENELKNKFPALHITYLYTRPSVCAQRNMGIQKASSSHILLCDDDIELRDDYILNVKNYMLQMPDIHVISGLFVEKNELGEWAYMYPITSMSQLCWKFIFQHSIWCNLENIKTNFLNKYAYQFIRNFYVKRKNTYTLAGWPLITDFNGPVFKTAFYSLGASIIKKEWLLLSPFDEALDRNGFGDNYGVALHFPQFPAIHILANTCAYHNKIKANRLSAPQSYYKRVHALNYFMSTSKQFNLTNKIFLIWSLLGNGLVHLVKGKKDFFIATMKLIGTILTSKLKSTRQ
jgi:glycosyltransferase involved in cell wall biosynthesis